MSLVLAARRLLQAAPKAAWWRASTHRLDGVAPGFAVDVLRRRFTVGGRAAALADVLTLTATAGKTYVDAAGILRTAGAGEPRVDWASGVPALLLEGAATNLLLGSDAPATQSATVAAGSYTLSFWGGGSVVLSGAASGTLAGAGGGIRSSMTVTCTAGALTLTVSGSVTQAQLEAGAIPTSYITTTGAAATRPADLCQLTPAAAAVLQGAGCALAWRGTVPTALGSQNIVGLQSVYRLLRGSSVPATAITISGVINGVYDVGFASGALPGEVATCVGFGASGRRACNAGGTVFSDGTLADAARTSIYLGGPSGLAAGQVLRLRQFVGWALPDRPSAAGTQQQARAAS